MCSACLSVPNRWRRSWAAIIEDDIILCDDSREADGCFSGHGLLLAEGGTLVAAAPACLYLHRLGHLSVRLNHFDIEDCS